jgi:RNA-directed DNA polymerase
MTDSLPYLANIYELTSAAGVDLGEMKARLNNKANNYQRFRIPKRTGGYRLLLAPQFRLRQTQNWIRENILDRLSVNPAATAYRKGMSTSDNAKPHEGHDWILRMDIQNFFMNIREEAVNKVFEDAGYHNSVTKLLTDICTFSGFLPQGAPTSPALSNLISKRMDVAIGTTATHFGAKYTRYSDDLVISSDDRESLWVCGKMVRRIVRTEGFRMNRKKMVLAGPGDSRRITGLVIGSNGVGIGRRKEREIRAMIDRLGKKDMQNNYTLIAKIKGYLAYVSAVDTVRFERLNAQFMENTVENLSL